METDPDVESTLRSTSVAPGKVSGPQGAAVEPGDSVSRRSSNLERKLNALRAGVLGANDGIVSTAAVVIGMAGATTATGPIATAGIAAALGGAVSMALGEYVSVSSQTDSESTIIEAQRQSLRVDAESELDALARIYEDQGASHATSRALAEEMTRNNALEAHLRARHALDPTDVASPWHAAVASFVAFGLGALLPLLAMLLPGPDHRVAITFVATLAGLALTGAVAAWIGGGPRSRAALRVIVGGSLALGVTYVIGSWLGTTGLI